MALALLDRDPGVGLPAASGSSSVGVHLQSSYTRVFQQFQNCTFAAELRPGPFTKSHVKVKGEKNIPTSANFTSDSSLLLQMQAQNTFNTRGRRVAQASRGSAPHRLTASPEAVTEISLICSPSELTPLTSGDAVIAAGVSFMNPVTQKVPFIGFTVC